MEQKELKDYIKKRIKLYRGILKDKTGSGARTKYNGIITELCFILELL